METTMIKRIVCFCSFLVLAMFLLSGPANAQTFPSRPVKIVVGFTPGGSNDVVARILAEHLGKMWGQPVIVENRPGANASIASTYVASSPPDGLTLLVTPPSTMIIEAALRPKSNFDPARDLEPVIGLASVPYVLVVNPSMPAKSLSDFINIAKRKPGEINYGWANPGMRIASEIFSQVADIKLFAIGYKGATQSIPGLLSGDVQMLLVDVAPVTGLIKSGKLRALAVSTPERSVILPDVPTMRESGIEFDWTGFMSLYAPKGTPPATLARIREDVSKVLKLPGVNERLLGLGVERSTLSTQALTQYLDTEARRITTVLKTGDFKLD
jgi:tripartite-type tricarboxylate transporter receptor subunit TctC